ncbi:MAG: ABC transporter substrate-binding protein [Rhodospirillales bacterium]|nr:ABC transporter substrate-binding protein [Rhodospirillales bacterium]
MMPRRSVFALPLALALLGAAPDPTVEAGAFIRAAGNDLSGIIGADTAPAEKRRRLADFLDRAVDIPAVARFCLGRFWRRATPAEQARYLTLYRGILLESVLARVGEYRHPEAQGMAVAIGRPDTREGDIYVPTTVTRPGQPPAAVTWVVRPEPGGPRIVDLIAEGTSLRITVRADYASFLNRHDDSIAALLDAMARQVSLAEAPAAGH